MTLSFICPVLNEERFITAWARNVRRFADQIVCMDMGSTDKTVQLLEREGIKPLKFAPTISKPYDWQEGVVRNCLISHCQGDYIVNLDADELLPEDFRETFEKAPRRLFYRMPHLDFWYSPQLLRIRQLRKDWWRRFYPSTQIRVFRNDPAIRYKEVGNHAPLEWRGMGKYSTRLNYHTLSTPFYHYHHVVFGKENENRAEEKFLSGIKLQTHFGPHPFESAYYDWWNPLMEGK